MGHYEGSVGGFAQVREIYECLECRSDFMGRDAYLRHRVQDDGKWRCMNEDEKYAAMLLHDDCGIWAYEPWE